METIRVSELGFTAFLLMKGCSLLEFDGTNWVVASKRPEVEWRVEWVNSDFAKFDKLLLDLKNFKRGR